MKAVHWVSEHPPLQRDSCHQGPANSCLLGMWAQVSKASDSLRET